MVTDDKKTQQDFGPFADDGLVARALRGELKPESGQSPAELPAFAEIVWMIEVGRLRIHFVTYDSPNSPNRMTGDYELTANDAKYHDVLERHPGLDPSTPSTFIRYHDGRWVLTRAGEVLASGNSQDRQTA